MRQKIMIVQALMLILAGSFLLQPLPVAARDLTAVIKEVKPGIAAVGSFFFKDTPKARFFGTGFAVGSGGLVVTNNHVLAMIEEKKRTFQLRVFHPKLPSRGVKASIVAKDPAHDLALLRLQKQRLHPLTLGDSSDVNEGESIAFTGYPIGLVLGLNPTTHSGIVSAISPVMLPSPTAKAIKGKHMDYLRDPYEIFQIDGTAFPGNSGSPVYRKGSGQVIGVINMVFVKDKKEHLLKEPTGITYAIPVKHVKALLKKALQ